MAYNLKKELEKPERLAGGHRLCAGCGAGIAVRGVLRALEPEDKAVITNATGCLEVSTFIYPHTAYYDSYIHTAFANAAATCSGVEAAYNVLKKKGKVKEDFKFITFGGDGGTYDIGLQSLSGAMERGHDMVYVCYDNEAYMNTGIQRSSSTPRAEQEESDGNHRGSQCSVCGSDDFYRELQGSSRKGSQGHLYSWSLFSQRAGAMSARLALRNTGDRRDLPPCSGNLRMASL